MKYFSIISYLLFLVFSAGYAAEPHHTKPFQEEVQKLVDLGEECENQNDFEMAGDFFKKAAHLLYENEATKESAKKMFIKSALIHIAAANQLLPKIKYNFLEYIRFLISADADFRWSESLRHIVAHKKTLIRGWNILLLYVRGKEEEPLYLDNIRRTEVELATLQRQYDQEISREKSNEFSLLFSREVTARTPEPVDAMREPTPGLSCWQILESLFTGEPKVKLL